MYYCQDLVKLVIMLHDLIMSFVCNPPYATLVILIQYASPTEYQNTFLLFQIDFSLCSFFAIDLILEVFNLFCFAEFDSGRNLVFFHGYRDCPLEKHGYVVALDRPCHVRRLTESNYSHSCDFFVVSTQQTRVTGVSSDNVVLTNVAQNSELIEKIEQ